MTTQYLAPLKTFLEQRYPQPNALWNASENNTLGTDWIYATPTDVWGKTYAEFKQNVPGDSTGFKLQSCTQAAGPAQDCESVGATVTAPGLVPQHLLVGHSWRMFEAMYEVMVSADILLDFTTLTPPTGEFLTAFQNAITCISNKPEAKRPVIRILYSNPPPNLPPLTAMSFLRSITDQLDPHAKMEIYVTILSSSFCSWNHAKIVAADGARALVGGHNMWGPHYLGINPVFDVSMRLAGSAARHAQDYANNLWDYELWRAQHLLRWIVGSDVNQEFGLHAAYRFDAGSGRCEAEPGVYPADNLYAQRTAQFPAPPAAAGTSVIAVGRGGDIRSSYLLPTFYSSVFPFTEPSDEAIPQLISLATSSVRASLQSFRLGPRGIIAGWNNELFLALAKAMQRGVAVNVVLSNPDAVAGGLTPLSAPYGGDDPAAINEKTRETLTAAGLDDAAAKQLIRDKFRIATFRFSAEASYPNGVPISNHAKTFIVDDKVFYIGSQNQYASNLNEFGYIVEDAAAAADYVARYWTPLWQYSSVTLTRAYDEDVEVTAQMEAMQFILALDQNTRMNVIWSDLLARYQKETGTTKDATGKLMDDLIVSGGFATTLANVLAGLRTPFFTETPPDTQASNEALRFVANLMTSPGLMKGFSDAVQAPADSVPAANQAITDFLQKNGYGCTALQVLAAFAAMRRKVLAYWAGNYTSWVTPDGGAAYTLNATLPTRRLLAADAPAPAVPALGPALVIGGDGSVTFDGSLIVDPLYNDNTLSWIAGSGNATAATLKFGTVTRAGVLDDFSGNEGFGTVTFPLNAPQGDVCSFYARNTDPAPANANDAGKQSSTVFYVLGAVAVAALLMLLAYCAFRSRAKQFEYARIGREKRQADLDESEIELEPVQSRGRQVETDLLVMEQVQRRVSLQRDSLMELVKYEGSMTTAQRTGLAESATKLNEVALALRNPTAEALHDVVATQAKSVATIQETVTGIAKESRAKISGESAELIENNAKLSNEAAATIEDYQKDQENDQPFEEDVL